MTQTVSVITGGGTGIGRALALRLAGQGDAVVVAGRRAEPLEELADRQAGIEPCQSDVSTEEGQAALQAAVGGRAVRFLVHNAGVLAPVGPLLAQPAEAIRQSLAINVEAPIALTRRLRERMGEGARILNISSGAAHRALPGWGAYCTSKAALYMVYEVLRQELVGTGIAIGSLRPGVVDTPMQSLIRAQDESDFPAVERFRALKEMGELTRPADVARFIDAVLGLPAETFSRQEWDIREHWDEVITA
ncbi:SDR family NAD(P)-dependent oxidoreductase [Spiribacter onubensis]|uniref:SDR family NAD(P)-dependent oxidoreductase n=1 Tax=Spiribacter onubensis TaxID=3122420 RepID=A0ABV3S7Y8_9GAMM